MLTNLVARAKPRFSLSLLSYLCPSRNVDCTVGKFRNEHTRAVGRLQLWNGRQQRSSSCLKHRGCSQKKKYVILSYSHTSSSPTKTFLSYTIFKSWGNGKRNSAPANLRTITGLSCLSLQRDAKSQSELFLVLHEIATLHLNQNTESINPCANTYYVSSRTAQFTVS